MNSLPRVAFMPGGIDGCGFWRSYMPALVCPRSIFYAPTERPYHLNLNIDVMAVQRQTNELNYLAIQGARARGVRILHDLDDDLWSIPRWNPGYEGVQKALPWLNKCLGASDLITVSTPALCRVVEKHGFGPVRILENGIHLDFFRRVPPFTDRAEVKIGWPSSPTHQVDGQIALAELVHVMREFPNVRCEFTSEMPETIVQAVRQNRIAADRVSFAKVPVTIYNRWMSYRDWDLMVAPLQDIPFNRSKSYLKMIEAGALRLPCLASDVTEYRRLAAGGLEPLLCKTREDWRDKLRWMVADVAVRREWGGKLYQRIVEQHQMKHRAQAWENAVIETAARPLPVIDMEKIEARLKSIAVENQRNAEAQRFRELLATSK